MNKPRLQIVKVRDQRGRVVQPVRWRWRAVINGHVTAGDMGQGYARRHRAREMGERHLRGEFANYVLEEED